MQNNVAYTGLSLCSGVEGLGLGLKIALRDFTILCGVEREAYPIGTLNARMQDGWLDPHPIWPNLQTFDGKPWRGKVDCVFGGYPCQPFSVAGKKQGVKDERHLWPHIHRIIDEAEPSLCFFENVANHLPMGFEQVLHDLERMDYCVAAGVFSAGAVGANHERKRLFIMAHHKSVRADRGVLVGCQTRRAEEFETAVEFQGSGEARRAGQGLGNPHGKERGDGLDSVAKGHLRSKEEREHSQTDTDGGRSGARTRNASQGVGNATGECKERPKRGRDSTGQPTGEVGDWGGDLFPPKPDGDWSRIEDGLKPEILRGADGFDAWMDRIKATGNAVVPLSAADAFCTLATAFTGE